MKVQNLCSYNHVYTIYHKVVICGRFWNKMGAKKLGAKLVFLMEWLLTKCCGRER